MDLAPLNAQQHCHLNACELRTCAQVRRVILEYIEAACDRPDEPAPMDASALDWKGGKGSKGSKSGRKGKGGKDGKHGKVKGKAKKGEKGSQGDDEKHRAAKFEGNCSHCGKYGHKKKD